ncbi:hypothetical protein VPHK567_0312 [Vibrio phage K567]
MITIKELRDNPKYFQEKMLYVVSSLDPDDRTYEVLECDADAKCATLKDSFDNIIEVTKEQIEFEWGLLRIREEDTNVDIDGSTIAIMVDDTMNYEDAVRDISRLQLSVNSLNRLNFKKIILLAPLREDTLVRHLSSKYKTAFIFDGLTDETADFGSIQTFVSFSEQADHMINKLGGTDKKCLSFSGKCTNDLENITWSIPHSQLYIDNVRPELNDIVNREFIELYDLVSVINTNSLGIVCNQKDELDSILQSVAPLGFKIDIITTIDSSEVKDLCEAAMVIDYNLHNIESVSENVIDSYKYILKGADIDLDKDSVIDISDYSDPVEVLGVLIETVDTFSVSEKEVRSSWDASPWEKYIG